MEVYTRLEQYLITLVTPAIVFTILEVLSIQEHYLDASYEARIFTSPRILSGALLAITGLFMTTVIAHTPTERFILFQRSVFVATCSTIGLFYEDEDFTSSRQCQYSQK